MQNIEVILIDEQDSPIGRMEKMEVHQKGLLHRAVTVYLFNHAGKLMLQQRALTKYHCGGLWSNTCCGHPYPGEEVQHAAERRLQEEMGLKVALNKITEIHYKVPVTDGLIEHELGHIFIGFTDELPQLNPEEAASFCYMSLTEVATAMHVAPEKFTPWFALTYPSIIEQLEQAISHR